MQTTVLNKIINIYIDILDPFCNISEIIPEKKTAPGITRLKSQKQITRLNYIPNVNPININQFAARILEPSYEN
jgi:hypothetical protein